MKNVVLLFGLLLFLFSCGSSTKVSSAWKKPGYTFDASNPNEKVLVVAIFSSDAQRRQIEDSFARAFHGDAVPSYTYFKKSLDQLNVDTVEQQLIDDDFNAAIVFNLTDHEEATRRRGGNVSLYPNVYYSFRGGFSGGVGLAFNPGGSGSPSEYTIETSVYAFPSKDIVWSSLSKTTNASSLDDLIRSTGRDTYDKMRSDGFLSN